MRWLQLFEAIDDETEWDDEMEHGDEDDDEDKFQHLPPSSKLPPLRPTMAAAAQKVYDRWIQDADDELNGGGICHLIAEKIGDVVSAAGIPIYTVSSSFEVHVYCIAQCCDGVFEIDIPWQIYERGGGYSWTKLPGVQFVPDDVAISYLDADPGRIGQYVEEL